MKKGTEDNLKNWSLNNNGHPKDDERLYEIVMSTLNEKISENDFLKIVKKRPKTSYRRYEDLRCFAKFLSKKFK